MNYVAVHHVSDVVEWNASIGKYESAGDITMLKIGRSTLKNQRTWADIAKTAEILSVRR